MILQDILFLKKLCYNVGRIVVIRLVSFGGEIMKKDIKVLIFLFGLITLGFLLTSLLSFFSSKNSIKNYIIAHELPLTSDNIYSDIQNDLLKPIFISSLMSSDTFLRDWVLDGEKEEFQIRKYLQDIKNRYGAFTTFFVSDKTDIYYQTEGILKKVHEDSKRDQWYFEAKKMKDDYEINIDVDMAHNDEYTIFINYKVYDYKLNFMGITGIGLKLDTVKKLIDSYEDRYSSRVYFVDKEGEIKLQSKNHKEKSINEIPYLRNKWAQIKGNKEENFEIKKLGFTNFVNTRYINEFGWHLIVEQSDKSSIGKFNTILLFNLLIALLITIVVVLITSIPLKKYSNELKRMALLDKLTGAYNRQISNEHFENLVKEANKKSFSVILMDIDDFKNVNDNFGHLKGDMVLKELAKLIKTIISKDATLFRWGGEEFLIFMSNTDITKAKESAENIRKIVENHSFETLKITLSIGVVEYREDETLAQVINRADILLYNSKLQGKNRVNYEE